MLNTFTDETARAITIDTIDKETLDKSLAKAPARLTWPPGGTYPRIKDAIRKLAGRATS